LIYFCIEKTPNQAHFSKISIQKNGPNLFEKNEKPASTEMDFIQKVRYILPSLDRRLKDEGPIFPMSINMIHKI
jgi:hypothetical protein